MKPDGRVCLCSDGKFIFPASFNIDFMLSDAEHVVRTRIHEAQRIPLMQALHMIAFAVARVGIVEGEDCLFTDGIPLCCAAAAGGGLSDKLTVSEHLRGQAMVDAGARVLQIASKKIGGNQNALVFSESKGKRFFKAFNGF